jgi:hypothetical protein
MTKQLPAWLALPLLACSGGQAEVDGTIVPLGDDDDDSVRIETGLEGTSVDAAFFAIVAAFAYDEENERFASYAHPDVGLVPMSLTVLLIDSSFMDTGVLDESNSCGVTLSFDGPRENAPWVEPNFGWAGVDVPADATVRDACRFYGVPPDFQGDVAKHVTKWTWGMGIGPLAEDTRQILIDSLPASEWAALEPYAVGASLNSSFLASSGLSESGFYGEGYGIGYEVDGNFQLVLGGTGNPQPIGKEFINMPGGIATGYYESQFLFQPGSALTNEPL